jgi:hypothetical protein
MTSCLTTHQVQCYLYHYLCMYVCKSDAVTGWLKILFRIQEVPGSNLSPETGYPEVFRDFSQSLQAYAAMVP